MHAFDVIKDRFGGSIGTRSASHDHGNLGLDIREMDIICGDGGSVGNDPAIKQWPDQRPVKPKPRLCGTCCHRELPAGLFCTCQGKGCLLNLVRRFEVGRVGTVGQGINQGVLGESIGQNSACLGDVGHSLCLSFCFWSVFRGVLSSLAEHLDEVIISISGSRLFLM
jgi:hypothetical protein